MYQRSGNSKGLVLVTGGAGYVGSHTLVELLNNNYDVVCLDNCSNAIRTNQDSIPESLQRVEQICGRKLIEFIDLNLLNEVALRKLFDKYQFDAVLHFAGLKAVGESCSQPLQYYQNNVTGTLNLLQAMFEANVTRLIFSSSCTVYGSPQYLPVDELHPTGLQIINPYGRTKHMIEQILDDCASAHQHLSIISLRYFNPIGAHKSGLIGEDPQGVPNNLMPYITQVAIGKLSHLNVFGNDYETTDGTGIRDYIHVMDLAAGHVFALEKLMQQSWNGFHPINLGTGHGYSVLELIDAFEKANQVKIAVKMCGRRNGDIGCVYADALKAKQVLGWQAKHSIMDMCRDGWKWQQMNPNGFRREKLNVSNKCTDGCETSINNGFATTSANVIEENNNHLITKDTLEQASLSKPKCKSNGNDSAPSTSHTELNNNVQKYTNGVEYTKLVD